MKKFLSTLLALTMLLALAAPALAENPTVTYYVRGGTAQYEPYLYETLVGLQKIQEMAGVDIDWTVVCGNGDEIKAQYVAMMASGNYPDIIQWQHNNSLGYVGGVAQMYADGIIIELNDVIDQYMPTCKLFWSPRRIMEPLPYIFSIWPMAASMARFRSSAGAALATGAFSFAIRSSSQI